MSLYKRVPRPSTSTYRKEFQALNQEHQESMTNTFNENPSLRKSHNDFIYTNKYNFWAPDFEEYEYDVVETEAGKGGSKTLESSDEFCAFSTGVQTGDSLLSKYVAYGTPVRNRINSSGSNGQGNVQEQVQNPVPRIKVPSKGGPDYPKNRAGRITTIEPEFDDYIKATEPEPIEDLRYSKPPFRSYYGYGTSNSTGYQNSINKKTFNTSCQNKKNVYDSAKMHLNKVPSKNPNFMMSSSEFHKNKLGYKRPKSAQLCNPTNKSYIDPPFDRWQTSHKIHFPKSGKKSVNAKVKTY